jgi:predicted Ser/Thr protein kinase
MTTYTRSELVSLAFGKSLPTEVFQAILCDPTAIKELDKLARLRNLLEGEESLLTPPDTDVTPEEIRDYLDGKALSPPRVEAVLAFLNAEGSTGRTTAGTGNTMTDEPGQLPQPQANQVEGELGQLGGLLLLKLLGEGGMGIVHKAHDPQLKRDVAVKRIKPGQDTPIARERFKREAQAAAGLKHENIVKIHRVAEDGGVPFMEMEYLEGVSLEDHLKNKGQLPIAEALRIAWKIAKALQMAHEKGVTHRDIKPSNIFLVEEERGVVLLDFGLARNDADPKFTKSGIPIGTAHYMSIEQARGEGTDAKTDLFSLGVVLYRMVTGQLPFGGDNLVDIFANLKSKSPTPPSKINREVSQLLEAFILGLLQKEATKRPTAAEAARTLEAMCANTKVMPPPPPKSSFGGWLLALAVMVLFAIVAVPSILMTLKTPLGEITVEVPEGADTKDIEIKVAGADGGVKILDAKSGWTIGVREGKFDVKLSGGHDRFQIADKEVVVTRNKKTIVRLRLKAVANPPKAPEIPHSDSIGTLAEFVLSVGGKVRINNEDKDRTKLEELPKERFDLTYVDLDKKKFPREEFARFKGTKHLQRLLLRETNVTDDDLVHFTGNKDLIQLELEANKVGDRGMVHLKGFAALQALGLGATNVSDAGLENLKRLTNLTALGLDNSNGVGDVGLAHLKDCKNLMAVGLGGTKVTNKSLPLIRSWDKLHYLSLGTTQVTDLTPLKGLKLTTLICSGAEVTDLSPIKEMPRLAEIWCDYKRPGFATVLRSLKGTLITINGKEAAKVLEELDAKKE